MVVETYNTELYYPSKGESIVISFQRRKSTNLCGPSSTIVRLTV